MKLAAVFAALVLVAACGSESGSQAPRYDVTISYWPAGRGGEARSATLQCDPDGGSHPDPSGACDVLLQHEDALQPTPGNVACTEIYGGPQLATIEGPGVHAVFSRTNGCEIARWDALKAVLELPD
jgi:Subtilisin inhibitor-like